MAATTLLQTLTEARTETVTKEVTQTEVITATVTTTAASLNDGQGRDDLSNCQAWCTSIWGGYNGYAEPGLAYSGSGGQGGGWGWRRAVRRRKH